MDINSVITKEEFTSIKALTYEQLAIVISKIVKVAVEESLKSIPSVISHITKQADYIKQLSDKFYKDNPELVNHKDMVSKVIEQLEADNVDKKLEQLLPEAAIKAKSHLNQLSSIKSYKGSRELSTMDSNLGKL